MSTVTAGVTNASFGMTITQSTVSPVSVAPVISVPLTFGSVSYVNTTSGSYTANNNVTTIHSFSTTTDLPRWIFLLVDQPVSMTLTTSAGTVANQMPVQRFFFSGSPSPVSNYSAIKFDSTVLNPAYVMAQNVAVNYSLYWGDGSLS